MTQRTSPAAWVAIAALLGALVAAILVLSTADSGTPPAVGAQAALAAAPPGSDIYERAVAVALPSVVQIETDKGLGSGIVLDAAGDVVTNAHVVAGASRFVVTDARGATHAATLRGAFPPDDVAVVHTDTSLPPATFADSARLRVGQLVLAIGNPLGLRSSATQGIVSATSRTVSEGGGVALSSVIQTSAAINPGNSGGALIDLRGRVVGMPTLAARDPELGDSAAPGIGFAISSNSVRQVVRQLVTSGHVTRSGRASLGVDLRSDPQGGALVAAVTHGGPCDRAGIRPGDVIAAIASRPTQTVDDVAATLAALRPGQRVALQLIAVPGGRRTARVTLGDAVQP
jgi:S1-C subfamily serine protease